MKSVYHFALIDCGWIVDSKYAPGISALPDGEITALCDIRVKKPMFFTKSECQKIIKTSNTVGKI